MEKTSFHEWRLRDEIYAGAHRWPVIVVFCLIGALLGALVAQIWPSPFRASSELYVGLEIYRSLQDPNVVVQFNYPDDYKNWQMANLEAMTHMPQVIDPTLERLRQADPYWQDVHADELRSMLGVYWRNAGKWRLVAEHSQSRYASQVASAWSEVVLEQVSAANAAGHKTFELDNQLKSVATWQAELLTRQAAMQSAIPAFAPDTTAQPADVLAQALAQLQALNAPEGRSPLSNAAAELLAQAPATADDPAALQAWLETGRQTLSVELEQMNAQMEGLAAKQAELAAQYAEASQQSLGVSANLTVQRMNNEPPTVARLRPTADLVLVGAALGLLAWLGVWAAELARAQRTFLTHPRSAASRGDAR